MNFIKKSTILSFAAMLAAPLAFQPAPAEALQNLPLLCKRTIDIETLEVVRYYYWIDANNNGIQDQYEDENGICRTVPEEVDVLVFDGATGAIIP